MAAAQITSLGYEGHTPETLLDLLVEHGVRVLVDVRLNPISRKPGFSKRRLAESLAVAGIEYVHEPALGTPKEDRAAFQRGDGEEGRERVRERLAEGEGHEALVRLVDGAHQQHVAVLCLEHAPNRCHRQVVTTLAHELDPHLRIVELV